MKHELIVQRIKSMRTAELDQHRSNLELALRDRNRNPVELDQMRHELNLVSIELDERDVKDYMNNLFRFNFQ